MPDARDRGRPRRLRGLRPRRHRRGDRDDRPRGRVDRAGLVPETAAGGSARRRSPSTSRPRGRAGSTSPRTPTAHRVGPEIVVVHRLHGNPPRRHPARGRSRRRLPLPRGADRPHARLRGARGGLRRGPAAALDRRLSRGLGVQRPARRRRPLHHRRRLPGRALGDLDVGARRSSPAGSSTPTRPATRASTGGTSPATAISGSSRRAPATTTSVKRLREPLAGRARRRGAGPRLQRVVEAVPRRRSRSKRPSLRIRFAALWPEAAITPPPGWVPAPQR